MYNVHVDKNKVTEYCDEEKETIRFHRDLNSDRWIQSPEC